jgi:hypothetical protein
MSLTLKINDKKAGRLNSFKEPAFVFFTIKAFFDRRKRPLLAKGTLNCANALGVGFFLAKKL